MTMHMTVIIIPKGGYGPFHKVQKNKKRSSNGGGGVLYKTKTLVKNTCNITLLYFFLTIGYNTQIFHLLQFYMHACGIG